MIRPLLIVAAAALSLLAAACAREKGTVYALPYDEARQLLLATGLPPMVFGTAEPDWTVRTGPPNEIAWIVKRNGGELFRYTATLDTVDNTHTRVAVALTGAASGPGGDVAQKLADNPSIRALYEVAVEERVASALERRPFDLQRIAPAMATATVANLDAINRQFDEASAEFRRRDRANIEKAYRDEAAGRRY